MRVLLCSLSVLCLAFAPTLQAQSAGVVQHPSPAFRQGVDEVINKHAYRMQTPAGTQWLDGSERYTALEPSAANPKQFDLVAYVTATGERSVLVPASSFIPAGTSEPLDIDDYTWSADKQQLLLFANTQKVWRLNTRGDYWVLNLADGKLRKVGAGFPAAS